MELMIFEKSIWKTNKSNIHITIITQPSEQNDSLGINYYS